MVQHSTGYPGAVGAHAHKVGAITKDTGLGRPGSNYLASGVGGLAQEPGQPASQPASYKGQKWMEIP